MCCETLSNGSTSTQSRHERLPRIDAAVAAETMFGCTFDELASGNRLPTNCGKCWFFSSQSFHCVRPRLSDRIAAECAGCGIARPQFCARCRLTGSPLCITIARRGNESSVYGTDRTIRLNSGGARRSVGSDAAAPLSRVLPNNAGPRDWAAGSGVPIHHSPLDSLDDRPLD